MSAPQHSPQGLSNLYLFYRVDAVVFVEGGESRSIQDILAGKFDSESQDVAFWQKCFTLLKPTAKLTFRAVGAKPTLKEIARHIATGAITHVYVAMDRDFDHLSGELLSAPGVFYTQGYSWENDVWNTEVIEEVFHILCGICRETANAKVKQIIGTTMNGLARDIRWAIKADYLCLRHGLPCLPRQAPNKVITEAKHGNPPSINRAAIRQCIQYARNHRNAKVVGPVGATNPLADCCGHVIGAFGYSVLGHLFRKFCKRKSHPRDLVDSVAINTLFERIRAGSFPSLRQYYEQQLTAA